jgi:hypothetical protein
MTDNIAFLPHLNRAKLTRALAILTTEVDETDIAFQGYDVIVRGQHFDPREVEDQAVLAILMADKEFGFAVSAVEIMVKELRALQKLWFDAAKELGIADALKAEVAQSAARSMQSEVEFLLGAA